MPEVGGLVGFNGCIGWLYWFGYDQALDVRAYKTGY